MSFKQSRKREKMNKAIVSFPGKNARIPNVLSFGKQKFRADLACVTIRRASHSVRSKQNLADAFIVLICGTNEADGVQRHTDLSRKLLAAEKATKAGTRAECKTQSSTGLRIERMRLL